MVMDRYYRTGIPIRSRGVWTKAIDTANYLLNAGSVRSYWRRDGQAKSIQHLWIFGSIANVGIQGKKHLLG